MFVSTRRLPSTVTAEPPRRCSRSSCSGIKLAIAALLVWIGPIAGGCGDDPLSHCPIPRGRDSIAPDLMGDCGIILTQSVVVASYDEFGEEGLRCRSADEQIPVLMAANPELHLALAVYSASSSCSVETDYGAAYNTVDGFLVTHVTQDSSDGCFSRCGSSGASWYAFLVEPGTEVEFCGGVSGGC